MPGPPRPLPVLPGVHYARVIGTFESLPSTNVFAFQVSPASALEPDDRTDAAMVANVLGLHWSNFVAGQLSSTYSASEVAVYPLGHPLTPAQVQTISVTGPEPGNLIGAQVAFLYRHTVDRRGRGSQSRTSVTPVVASQATPDGLSVLPAYRSGAELAFQNMISSTLTDLDAFRGSWRYVQLSKIPPGATYNITSTILDSRLATQRRRTRRSG